MAARHELDTVMRRYRDTSSLAKLSTPSGELAHSAVLGSLNRQMFYNLVSIYWPSFILRSNSFHDDLLFNP